MQLILTAADPAQTSLTLVNGTAATGYALLAGAEWGNAVWDQKFGGPRGTQGARAVFAQPQNRPVVLPLRLYGTSMDDLAAKIATLSNVGRLMLRFGGRIQWQANAQTRRQFFSVLAAGVQRESWGNRAESKWIVDASFQAVCAPYLLGDPMDAQDDFATDQLASGYTFDSGSAGICTVTGGALAPNGSLATERRAIWTLAGYSVVDAQATVRTVPGATIASYKAGVALCRSSATTYLDVYVDDDGANSRLRIDKVIGGSRTNLASTNLGARVANGSVLWVRGRREGAVVIAEHFTSLPTPGGAPATTNTVTLSSAEQASLVAGLGGWVWTPQHASALLDDWTFEPFTYRARSFPNDLSVSPADALPGDAPALADAVITPSGGSAAPSWAWLAWSDRPQAWNRCWNGDLEEDANGWSAAAVTGVTGAATSALRVTAAGKQKYGLAGLEIVTPATANTGGSFLMVGRFRKGVTYTAELWAAGVGGSTTNTRLRLGVNGDIASETPAALTGSMVRRTVTWTPAADTSTAYVAFEVTAATLTTMQVDGVMVYEGATAPALQSQSEGRGACPVFGLVDAAANDTGDLVTWAAITDANYRAGVGIRRATSGAETPSATWFVDPAVVVPDDFTQGELDVEVFARIELASTVVSPRLTLSTVPEAGTSYGPARYTAEFGSAGKLLKLPSSGTVFRVVRLGTLTFLVDRQRPVRWKLRLAGSYAAGSTGSFGVDYLFLAAARMRACGPTGKALDATYPKFVQSTGETTKTIKSDLSGRVRNPGSYSRFDHPDAGLGGSLLELPAAAADVAVKLSSLVPDDPTSDATNEQLAHTATLHLAVTPRYHLARAS